MGYLEIAFIAVWIMFAVIGVIRGYPRELGVTAMLLIALFVTEFIEERYQAFANRALAYFVGSDATAQLTARMLLYCGFLIVIAYIAYEGDTLVFRGKRGKLAFDLGNGILNGYLFVGSLWYYLNSANYPLLGRSGDLSPLNQAIIRFLPPAVFTWQYLIVLVILLILARFWK
ncbi:MAG: hypothetical protein BWY52_03171 [Chloroflexi bacterium ADurb.Bin325]|nr:MAG: hypothetical protein BWY52_03171 [Chloroflexi bacterium ADurb.Bin325]